MQTNRRRIIAFAAAAVMVLTTAFSVIFVVHSAKHECKGVDCQVCGFVGNCLQHFKNHTPKPEASAVSAVLLFAVVLTLGTALSTAYAKTLIELKVKLSD